MATRVRALAVAGAMVLALSGCGLLPGGGDGTSQPTRAGGTPADAELAAYYGQSLDWRKCDDGFQCATLKVPLDYEDPSAGDTSISVVRLHTRNPRGSIILNPGGPGASGVDYALVARAVVGKELRKAFDIVGFDPRGVSRSDPVDCLTDAQVDELMAADGTPDDRAEIDQVVTISAEVGAGCLEHSPRLAAHIDTISAARDMDILRAALGDDQLNYLGKSYGTLLGAQYAELYPERVGRLVLDGVLPGDLDGDEITHGQAVAFDIALRRFVADCVTLQDCPLPRDVGAAMARVTQFLDDLETHPLPGVGERQLNQALGTYAVLTLLYDWQIGWSDLRYGLEAAFEGDGSVLMDMMNEFIQRDATGRYHDNGNEAFYAVSCLDRPGRGGVEHVEQLARDWEATAPIFGPYLAWGTLPCSNWPIHAEAPAGQPQVLRAKGSGPILVLSTTYDPATPYAWGVKVADELENASLLTFEGDGHTAYGSGSTCIDRAVEAYYLDGTVPADGTTCQPDPIDPDAT